jgi:tetratricopeptide (TPR) repeat protein
MHLTKHLSITTPYALLLLLLLCGSCKKRGMYDHLSGPEREKLSMEYYQRGFAEEEFHQGSVVQRQLYDTAIMINPKNAEAWFEKGSWNVKIGDYVNYFTLMNKAVELNPKVYMGWRGSIKLYVLKDYEGAIKDIEGHAAVFPGVTTYTRGENANYLIRLAKKQQGKYEQSITYFNKCADEIIKDRGEKWVDIHLFVYRGIARMRLEQYREAITDFDIALRNYDKIPESYYHKALALQKLGESAAACQNLDKAMTIARQGYIYKEAYKDVID